MIHENLNGSKNFYYMHEFVNKWTNEWEIKGVKEEEERSQKERKVLSKQKVERKEGFI